MRIPAVAFASVLVIAAVATIAGPLDPPAGPIASTSKPLAEIEPRTLINAVNTPGDGACLFRITKSGSYYLGGSVSGVPGRSGILIAASDVTVDLNGYDMVGVGASQSAVVLTGASTNIVVQNGHVLGPWNVGVDLVGTAGSNNTRIEGIEVNGANLIGLRCGSGGLVNRCSVVNINPPSGIAIGIIGFAGATNVTHCQVSNVTGFGIAFGIGGQASNCCATGCSSGGFTAISECTFTDCVAHANPGPGFTANENGIIGAGVNFINCTAAANQNIGFVLVHRDLIRDCVATDNSVAGIVVQGMGCRVDNNHVTGSPTGIQVTGTGNIIIRNSSAQNSLAYSIGAGNDFAPIATAAAATSPLTNIKD